MKTFTTSLLITIAAIISLSNHAYAEPPLSVGHLKWKASAIAPVKAAPSTAGQWQVEKYKDAPIYLGGQSYASLGAQLVKYGQSKMGQFIGARQCTDFVSAALASAGARPGNFNDYRNYIWGTRIDLGSAQPGDIIQFEYCQFKWTSGNSWGTINMDHHTAIIESVSGTSLSLLHQNAPIGGPVARQQVDLNWKQQGTYTIWRAVK